MKRTLMAFLFGLVVAIGANLMRDGRSAFADGNFFMTDLPIIVAGGVAAVFTDSKILGFCFNLLFAVVTGVCLTAASGGKYTATDGKWWVAYVLIFLMGNIYAMTTRETSVSSQAKNESKPKNNNMIDPA